MDAKEALERLYPAMQDAHVQRSKFYAPRGPVKTEADADNDLDLEALAVLRAVVDERDALKAEVEGLRTQLNYPDPEDMPGELAANYCPFKDPLHFHHDGCPSEWAVEERAEKAEAELAAARPLLKEIEEAAEDELDLTLQSMRVWEAALTYRSAHEHKEPE
jgi:hypothetical protein